MAAKSSIWFIFVNMHECVLCCAVRVRLCVSIFVYLQIFDCDFHVYKNTHIRYKRSKVCNFMEKYDAKFILTIIPTRKSKPAAK